MKSSHFWAIIGWWLSIAPLLAQRTDSLFVIQPEEILQDVQHSRAQEASIASKRKQTLAQAPAILTVITSQDIARQGCKDMADILRLVPGFEFGMDVQSTFGLGSRGLWAHEGKALLLINNAPVNCFGYGNTNFFGSYPAAMIDRVEIIRGPGSTLYGGFAEVAVINIMTKKGNQLRGAEITITGGALSPNNLAYGANINAGLHKDDWDISFHVGTTKMPTSTRTYTDFAGNSYQLSRETAWRKWTHIIGEATYRGFHFSYSRIKQDFLGEDMLGFVNTDTTLKIHSEQFGHYMENMRASYEFAWGKRWSFKPNIAITQGNAASTPAVTVFRNSTGAAHNPWYNPSILGGMYQAEWEASYTPTEKDAIIAGIGGQLHTIKTTSSDGSYSFLVGEALADSATMVRRTASYGFAQYTHQSKYWGFTVGARQEFTPFGNAFLPRVGVTWAWGAWNAKLLFGRAFRVPTLYQVYSRQYSVRGATNPETTNTFDFEMGYKWEKGAYLRLNLFHTTVYAPITYLGFNNAYQNYGVVRSMGIELEAQAQGDNYQYFANFSYARPDENMTTADFMNGANNAFLALPTLKANAGGSLTYQKMTVGSTLTWLGKRYAQTQNSALNSTATTLIRETTPYPAVWLWNANILLKGIFSPNLSLRLNAYNVLNAPYLLLQPYYGGHAPMPVGDRQVDMAVMVKF